MNRQPIGFLAGVLGTALLVSGCSSDYMQKRHELRLAEARDNAIAKKRWAGVPGLRFIEAEERAERADAAYEKQRWGEALEQYRDLAAIGDKFSQYRLAVMHARGLGVPADPAEAFAWATLAAEFNQPEFLEYRSALGERLDEAQRAEAEARVRTLARRHSHLELLTELADELDQSLNDCTGSRLGSTCRNGTLRISTLSQSAPGTSSLGDGGAVLTQSTSGYQFYGPVYRSIAMLNHEIDLYLRHYGGNVVIGPLELDTEPAPDASRDDG